MVVVDNRNWKRGCSETNQDLMGKCIIQIVKGRGTMFNRDGIVARWSLKWLGSFEVNILFQSGTWHGLRFGAREII
jgi:hypothetical protein